MEINNKPHFSLIIMKTVVHKTSNPQSCMDACVCIYIVSVCASVCEFPSEKNLLIVSSLYAHSPLQCSQVSASTFEFGRFS